MYNIWDQVQIISLEEAMQCEWVEVISSHWNQYIMYWWQHFQQSYFNRRKWTIIYIHDIKNVSVMFQWNRSNERVPFAFIIPTNEPPKKYHTIKLLSDKWKQKTLLYFPGMWWFMKWISNPPDKFPLSIYERQEHILVSIDWLSKKDFYKITSSDKSYTWFKKYLSKFKCVG